MAERADSWFKQPRPNDGVKKPSNSGLDIFRTLRDDVNSETLMMPKDREELIAISRWIRVAEERAAAHLVKGRWFKFLNRILSFAAVILSSAAGSITAVTESELGENLKHLNLEIISSLFSFIAVAIITTNNSILDCPGKHREHMSAESGYNYVASNMAVSLATYDRELGMANFKTAAAALSYFHVTMTHLNDTTPDA